MTKMDDRIVEKLEEVHSSIERLNVRMAEIGGHLKELNGKVARNVKEVELLRQEDNVLNERINDTTKTLMKVIGAGLAIMAVIGWLVSWVS